MPAEADRRSACMPSLSSVSRVSCANSSRGRSGVVVVTVPPDELLARATEDEIARAAARALGGRRAPERDELARSRRPGDADGEGGARLELEDLRRAKEDRPSRAAARRAGVKALVVGLEARSL